MFEIKIVMNVVLIIAAMHVGLVAYNGMDVVSKLTEMSGKPELERYVKLAIGLAGVFALYQFVLENRFV